MPCFLFNEIVLLYLFKTVFVSVLGKMYSNEHFTIFLENVFRKVGLSKKYERS